MRAAGGAEYLAPVYTVDLAIIQLHFKHFGFNQYLFRLSVQLQQ